MDLVTQSWVRMGIGGRRSLLVCVEAMKGAPRVRRATQPNSAERRRLVVENRRKNFLTGARDTFVSLLEAALVLSSKCVRFVNGGKGEVHALPETRRECCAKALPSFLVSAVLRAGERDGETSRRERYDLAPRKELGVENHGNERSQAREVCARFVEVRLFFSVAPRPRALPRGFGFGALGESPAASRVSDPPRRAPSPRKSAARGSSSPLDPSRRRRGAGGRGWARAG